MKLLDYVRSAQYSPGKAEHSERMISSPTRAMAESRPFLDLGSDPNRAAIRAQVIYSVCTLESIEFGDQKIGEE